MLIKSFSLSVQNRATACKILDLMEEENLAVPTDNFYQEHVKDLLHPYYLSSTFSLKTLFFFVDRNGRQYVWYLNDGIGFFVVSKCVTPILNTGQRWFFDISEDSVPMEGVLEVLKDSVEAILGDLVNKFSMEVHIQEGSTSRILSFQSDDQSGRFWAEMNTAVSSIPIMSSLDLLTRVSSSPLPLTPTEASPQSMRLFAEVSY